MRHLTSLLCVMTGLLTAPAAAKPPMDFSKAPFAQHEYVPGEVLTYDFEDTESTYEGTLADGVLQPASLTKFQAVRIPYTISIQKDGAAGKLKRVLRYSGGTYREGGPVDFSSAPAVALSSAVSNFPADFSYEYSVDGKAVQAELGRVFGPYMADPIGMFIYTKALDIHTIQSRIDGIPPTLHPGDLIINPAGDIPLPIGIFHNGSTSTYYQRIEKIDGVPCAYFKVVTMANKFTPKTADKADSEPIFTNYQYTFYVPLEGPDRGLLLKGELQETATALPQAVVQRQFSIALRKHLRAR